VVFIFVPKSAKYRDLQLQKARLQEQQDLEELKLGRLQRQQEQFATDPAAVERTAREAGMVKSNETVCRFTEGIPETAGPGASEERERRVVPR
jgi:hypothetical protein